MVAAACTTLLAGAVFSLLDSSARASRAQWGTIAAQAAVDAAVTAVARDVHGLGLGFERADAMRVRGTIVPLWSAAGQTGLRLVRTLSLPLEIRAQGAGAHYEVAPDTNLLVGATVIASGMAGRPRCAALPAGTIINAQPRLGSVDVDVAWDPAEAALIASWGPPRALTVVRTREYRWGAFAGGTRLRRRDAGGAWQSVAEDLSAFAVSWALDSDGDGIPDSSSASLPPASTRRAAHIAIEASAAASAARLRSRVGSRNRIVAATRWASVTACRSAVGG